MLILMFSQMFWNHFRYMYLACTCKWQCTAMACNDMIICLNELSCWPPTCNLHVEFATMNNINVWMLTKRAPSHWVESLSRITKDRTLWQSSLTCSLDMKYIRPLSPSGGLGHWWGTVYNCFKRAGGKKKDKIRKLIKVITYSKKFVMKHNYAMKK